MKRNRTAFDEARSVNQELTFCLLHRVCLSALNKLPENKISPISKILLDFLDIRVYNADRQLDNRESEG